MRLQIQDGDEVLKRFLFVEVVQGWRRVALYNMWKARKRPLREMWFISSIGYRRIGIITHQVNLLLVFLNRECYLMVMV